MGTQSAGEIDAWLRDGGLVVAASERAARAVATAYHRGRRAAGLKAWPAPQVQNWDAFARRAWEERTPRPRLPLNGLQEQSLWAEIIAAESARATLLEGPLHRVANLAMEAHRLLCLHAPQFLRPAARSSWQQDAGAFSGWLAAFEEACITGDLISAPRLPIELTDILQSESVPRPPLLLAGFDRILPIQRRLLDAWGEWRGDSHGDVATRISFYHAPDENAELAACALWCKRQLAAAPNAHLLIVTPDVAKRRGEFERAFMRFAESNGASTGSSRLIEFSLGVPLQQAALARGALLVLRWLEQSIAEHELDWLLSTGQMAANDEESRALSAFMRALRRRGWERTHWRFDDFSRQRPGQALPAGWMARMTQAKRRLEEWTRKPSGSQQRTGISAPMAWAELVPHLLQDAGWPGGHPLTSAEFQVMRRWEQVLDECASLGFDGRRMEWKDFLQSIERTMNETLFAPESQDAPILIAGPAESAGLTADAIWFLGASEDTWPAPGTAHPLLPLEVQRNAQTPHASAQLDWDIAAMVTDRLLASAPEIHFSYARLREGIETRPSRLIVKAAGAPMDMPKELAAPFIPDAQTVWFEDHSRIPFCGGEIAGGSTVLTAQSQCAFKAFATARLGAQAWEPAQAGLTAAQRGQLLHAVLHAVWGPPPEGIRSHAELMKLADLRAFVEKHVQAALRENMPAGARERMPRRYLELEQTRLLDLVTQWLQFEATRAPFLVEDTEVERHKTIAGLTIRLRLDRLDRLGDGTFLVIDYKSGDVSPTLWEMPRPDDVQLPLYAGFALDRETEPLGGLLFAKIRAGQVSFAGRAFKAKEQLSPSLSARNDIVKRPLEIEDLIQWRDYIEGLARAFLEGRADVNPREYPATCERCGLQTLCRVHENLMQREDDDEESEEAEDV